MMTTQGIGICRWVLLLGVVLGMSQRAAALPTSDYAIQVSAQVQASPPRITLGWPTNAHAINCKVYRKLLAAPSWGSPLATLPAGAQGFADTNVSVGTAYEYQVEVLTDYYPYPNGSVTDWLTAYGYCYAAIDAPLIEDRGKVILIVDDAFSGPLSNELAQLQQDLVGDGWTVLRHDVNRSNSVPSVKALIVADYNADPANVRSVFLLGHVPVPYSGALNPDGHEDHIGAWPADAYYGDMNGNWPDANVNDTSAQYARNHNVPGDGKFDPSSLPSEVELEVGRVDMFNLPAFAPKTELDLLRQYLNKDHNFRLGTIQLPRRGLLRDNFGDLGGEAPAACGWRNLATLLGSNTTVEVQSGEFFPTLATDGYLWAYGCGGGAFHKADGVGFTSDFAATDTRAVFMVLFGSYFGDWDSQDDFLRAPLATPTYTLTCAWGGYPHWYFQHMALGWPIGFSTRRTQNNDSNGVYRTKVNSSALGVHVALMGDPTLRMHPFRPPSQLDNYAPGVPALSWTASPDSVLGYHVYRGSSANGPFSRITPVLVSGTSFTDSNAPLGIVHYMVRAVRRETSGSGTYMNPSQGIFLGVNLTQGTGGCAPGPTGLLDWWPGDGNALDLQSTNHGALQGGTGFTAGLVGPAFTFDGVDDLVTVGNKYASLINNFTLMFWARPTAGRVSTPETLTGDDGFAGQRYAIHPVRGRTAYGTGHSGFGVSVGTNGVSVFEYGNTFLPSLLVFNTPLTAWTHVAVVCSNKVPALYLNGVWKRTGLASPSTPHPSADLSGSLGYYQGDVDEVQVFNRALTPAEVQAVAVAGTAGVCKQIQIQPPTPSAPGQLQLAITGRTGRIAVEVSTNFLHWTQIGSVTNVTGAVNFLDVNASTQARRFYRARLY